MRKFLLLCLVTLFSAYTWAYDFEVDGIYYSITSEEGSDTPTVEVTWGGTSDSSGTDTYVGEITIPEMVTYMDVPYTVTAIGDDAFDQCDDLVSVVMPNSVTSIGSYGFYSCWSLASVTLSENIKTIGNYAFRECYVLSSISFGDKLESIGYDAFNSCYSLTSIDIPNSVTEMGYYAFYDCSSLSSVVIGDGLKVIEESAFGYCSALKSLKIGSNVTEIEYGAFRCIDIDSLTIPDNVVAIGDWAFDYCASLSSLYIGSGVITIGEGAFAECTVLAELVVSEGNQSYCAIDNVLFTKDMVTLLQYPLGLTNETYTIPNGVVTISYGAFAEANNLKTVIFGNDVTTIGDYAFEACKYLTTATLNGKVTTIGEGGFDYCIRLENINLDNVITIGNYAFADAGLTNLTIPSSVTKIGEEAFSGASIENLYFDSPATIDNMGEFMFYECYWLESLTFGENVTAIAPYAFEDCSGYLEYVEIPDNITTIGDCAFFYCEELKEVSIGSGITSMGVDVFQDCSQLETVQIAEGITVIPEGTFSRCAITSINLPESVTTIEGWAFEYCGFNSITLGENVTSLGNNTFAWCSSLKTVNIGSNFSKFGTNVFQRCSSNMDITILNPTPPSCSGIFVNNSGTIHVPAGTIDVYKVDWSKVSNASFEELDYAVIKINLEEDGVGYATYYNIDYDVTMPEGVTAYTSLSVDVENDCGSLYMEEIGEKVSAGTAVVLRGNVGTYFDVVVEKASATSNENLLYGNSTSTTTRGSDSGTSYYYYELSENEGNVGFYWGTSTGGAFTVSANQVWLAVPQAEVSGLSALYMHFDEPFYGSFVCDVDPADKETISELSQVTFTNPNGGEILCNDDYPTYPEFNVYDEEGNLVTIMNNVTPVVEDGLEMAQVLTFGYGDKDGNGYPSVVTEEGTYYVTVPAEIFIIYDENGNALYNEGMTLTYIVSADATEEPNYALDIEPESGSVLGSLSTISISCEDGIMWNTLGWADVVVYDGNGDELDNEVTWEEVASSTGAITEVDLTISPTITAEGEYSVVIPEGYFLISGTIESKAITLEYTISTSTGILGISINDENVEGIYSVGGQKLNSTKSGVNIIRFSDGTTRKILIK